MSAVIQTEPSQDSEPVRGRAAAEEKLIAAAADLLAEVGPRAMSVRQIAHRAGVNHGLVHHYFKGKEGLLRAAMAHLVEEHARWAKEQSSGNVVPAPLALLGDQRYLRAVLRAVLDGEPELAQMELSTDVSVPRAALRQAVARRGDDDATIETKAAFGAVMALEMGWAALEPFIFAVTETSAAEADEVRATVTEFRRRMAGRYFNDFLARK